MTERYERYEIILPTDKISDLEENAVVSILYKMGFSVYKGIDGHICFTATDNEVTALSGKWVKD